MDYKDQKMVNALESIAQEFSLVSKNLNRIANSAIGVMPEAQPQIVYKCGGDEPEKQQNDNSLFVCGCAHVNECESVAALQKVAEAYEKRLKEVEARYNALLEAWDRIHARAAESDSKMIQYRDKYKALTEENELYRNKIQDYENKLYELAISNEK